MKEFEIWAKQSLQEIITTFPIAPTQGGELEFCPEEVLGRWLDPSIEEIRKSAGIACTELKMYFEGRGGFYISDDSCPSVLSLMKGMRINNIQIRFWNEKGWEDIKREEIVEEIFSKRYCLYSGCLQFGERGSYLEMHQREKDKKNLKLTIEGRQYKRTQEVID